MLHEVLATLLQCLQVLFRVRLMKRFAGRDVRTTAMHLQCTGRRDDHHCVRLQAAGAALDVAELLHAHVRAEAAFGEHVADARGLVTLLGTRELQRDAVGEDGRVPVRDVGERTRVDEDGGTLPNN